MRRFLMLGFVGVLAIMLWGTVTAVDDRSLVLAIEQLWPDPWFRVTILDTYFAFLTIWLWVAYKERTWFIRITWLALFCTLGSFAIAGYMLRELWRLAPDDPPERLLLRRTTGR